MPIQTRSVPTLADVERRIQEFEKLYAIDTSVFLSHDCRSSHVDEDDGMQWQYLHEQLCVLREAVIGDLYSNADEELLENAEDFEELLAA